MKSTPSESGDEASEDEDDQLYGVMLATGQELFGYLPYELDDGVLKIYKPLLAIKHFDPDPANSAMILHPWSIVSDIEVWPINAAHIVAVYPVTKDIRTNHQMVWERAISMLEAEPPQPKMVGKPGVLSDDATLIIPPQRYPN